MSEPRLRVLESIADAPAKSWNALLRRDDAPVLRWEWIHAMEASGSASAARGWEAAHFTLWRGETLVAADAMSGWWDIRGNRVYWCVEDQDRLTFWQLDEASGRSSVAGSAKGFLQPGRGGFTVGANGMIVFLKTTRASEDLMVAEFDRD